MNAIIRTVSFELNGRTVEALPHETLIEVAAREGVDVPRLCYKEGMEAVGNCRSCMVEIDGERVLAPSCCRHPSKGMKVTTDSPRAVAAQKMVLELLLADMPEAEYTRKNEVDLWADKLGVGKPRFAPTRPQPQMGATHAAITVNLDACIQCTRCLRACRDEQVNDVIGLAFRGEGAKIVFDQDDPMGASTCVACGECVQACPTGALMPAREVALHIPDKQVDSVCPYCGVGCQLTYNVKDNKILYVEGRDGPANHGRLCVKGRYGFDYAHHPHRLTKPLIRRAGVPKTGDFTMDPERVMDVTRAEVIVIIGANPTVNHPVAATWIKNAVRTGAKLIVLDPRRSELARHAHRYLQFKPDTDVALLNAMMHVIVTEGLVDRDFIASRTIGYEELEKNVAEYSPEAMAPICGIDAETIRYVARLYATSKGSMILWGMGVSQHVHGTDNARCLIALSLMTGQIGRPGTGLHPLRGQNNVQGASDAGLIPMMLPDYQRVDNPAARAKFEQAWGATLDPKPGLTVVEIMDAIDAGQIRGMYIMGENPAMSDPDANHARAALAALEHLVVQDIFLTETAYLADVILPASAFPEKTGTFTNTDRLVQLGRQAIDPPGDARQDLWIIQQMANRLGLSWNYGHVAEVFDEMRKTMASIGGITWERLERNGAVVYPCTNEGDVGQPVVFTELFPREGGKARFVPADIIPADERPDAEYPLVLITGRQLEHWHTGSMTRRATVLDAIEPDPVALVHPLDLERMGIQPGQPVTISSRRGEVVLYARADDSSPVGAIFVPFCYYEAAINRLTNAALDPFGKIPEFKYCAIKVTPGGEVAPQGSYGGGQILAGMAQLAT